MGKLTPGERFKNWIEGISKLWLLIIPLATGLGYTNKDEIRGFITAGDKSTSSFEDWATNEIERIDLEEATGRAEADANLNAVQARVSTMNNDLSNTDTVIMGKLNKQDNANYDALSARIDKLEALVD